MKSKEIIELKLEPALKECRFHKHRLEKLGAIPSAEQWNEIRQIRNRMTHEYPDAPELNADNVNRVVDSLSNLKNTLAQSETYP